MTTAQEVMAEAARVGLVLEPIEGDRIHYRGPLSPELRQGITMYKDQILAVLRLREVHRAMGYDEPTVLWIEDAYLSGKVSEIKIAIRPATEVAA